MNVPALGLSNILTSLLLEQFFFLEDPCAPDDETMIQLGCRPENNPRKDERRTKANFGRLMPSARILAWLPYSAESRLT